ncbi:MAG: hypothetical protein LBJ08_03440 [Bifidobacteriaceae bacterium]|jgi:hypothetical protein|nr:hypothetical protein [Bifidobacteriaceae bacterium]
MASTQTEYPAEGYFVLPAEFLVNRSALGRSFCTKLEDRPLVVTLPRAVQDSAKRDGWVIAEPEWYRLPDNAVGGEWGHAMSWRTGEPESAMVLRLRLAFASESDAQELASDLEHGHGCRLQPWWEHVHEWITATGNHWWSTARQPYRSHVGEIWIDRDEQARHVSLNHYQEINVMMHQQPGDPEPGLSGAHFETILGLVASGQAPPLELALLRQAEWSAALGDNREAVIVAGTAAEIALTKLIRSSVEAVAQSIADALLDKYRMLGNLIDLANRLGVELPNGATASLAKPRNDAVHSGTHPSDKEMYSAISITRKIVSLSSPLSELGLDGPGEA